MTAPSEQATPVGSAGDGIRRRETSVHLCGHRGQPVIAPPLAVRLAPLPLLVVSVLLGMLLTPALLMPERMTLSYLPTALLLVLRLAAEVLQDRLRVAGGLVIAGYVVHAAVLLAAVALNPFVCIYAFFGYVDADRFLGDRLATGAVVITGLTCAFGQAGGLPGVSATPALFIALSVVNVALALTMMRISVSREREVEARAKAVEELERAHQENLALQDQLLRQAHETGIAEERARLSRELHDTVAQGLVGVIRQLENLPTDLDPAARRRVQLAEGAARTCLVDARRAVRALGPQQLQDGDLTDAVRGVVESFSLANDIAAQVVVDGTPATGYPDGCGDQVIVRVVQEALSNVARHAGASAVTVTLSWLEDELIVDVRDDGVGFEPDTVRRGRGLDGMAERLAAAGGRLEIESRSGAGTTLVAAVPLEAR